MPHTFPRRISLSLVLSLLVFAAALVMAPASSLAQTPRTNCTSSSSNTRHSSRACAAAARKAEERRANAKKHHAKHKTVKAKHKKKSAAKPALTTYLPALCEDSTPPVLASDGGFSCEDGSEPTCENGVEPILSSNQSALLCAVLPGESEAEAAEASSEEPTSEESGEEPAGEEAES